MLKRFLHHRIRAFERRFDYDAGYMHEIADLDIAGMLALQRLSSASLHDGGLSLAAVYAAKLAAVMHEDCGPCAQLVIDMALDAGVAEQALAALAAEQLHAVDADIALAFHFARAVLNNHGDVGELRERVVARFGRRGPWVLGFAVATARCYPVVKRAMGHAHTCAALEVAGQRIVTPDGHPAVVVNA